MHIYTINVFNTLFFLARHFFHSDSNVGKRGLELYVGKKRIVGSIIVKVNWDNTSLLPVSNN